MRWRNEKQVTQNQRFTRLKKQKTKQYWFKKYNQNG